MLDIRIKELETSIEAGITFHLPVEGAKQIIMTVMEIIIRKKNKSLFAFLNLTGNGITKEYMYNGLVNELGN